ncbi:hypothetical protein ABBQ32_002838 [Trebouxia sp. C0010 RCD-2024]
MMMNGANCYGQDYTYLLSQLAGRGYLAVAPTQLHPAPPKQEGKDWSKAGLKIPDGRFLTYMAGQYNDQTQKKYEATKGKCIQYVELAAGNHYAITDYNPDTAPHQV